MQHYFITGLPRSRTGWLANLLTYGPSFCWHDAVQHGWNAAGVMGQLAQTPAQFAGDSDSGLVLMHEELNALAPQAQWVFVLREQAAAEESFLKYFAGRSYKGTRPVAVAEARQIFGLLARKLEQARRFIPGHRAIEVEFAALERREVAAEIWAHCVPGVPFHQQRWELLDKLQVNPVPEKVRVI